MFSVQRLYSALSTQTKLGKVNMAKFTASTTNTTMTGTSSSDIFFFNGALRGDFIVTGGTTTTATSIGGVNYFTDYVIAGYTGNTGVPNSGNVNNALTTPKAVDTIWFTKSGDYTNIEFSQIEAIRLSSGVTITLSNEQMEAANDSLNYGPSGAYNPGLHFYGVGGGKAETVKFEIEYDRAYSFTGNGVTTTYAFGDLQFDDYDIGNVFHDVKLVIEADDESTTSSYFRGDGSNNDDYVDGSKGVDNFDGRLGNDTYFGNTGNDKLTGQGGADSLYGGAGNDFFLITSMHGTDGEPEWVDGDLIVGDAGLDTLRVTGAVGYSATSEISLNDTNFKSMERVEVGGLVTRLTSQDSGLQLLGDNYYFNAGGTITGGSFVTIDASGVTKNGLTFVGNADTNTFIGTTKDDIFIGNGGNDTLTGGAGNDRFEFGKVSYYVANNTTKVYDLTSVALTGTDTITDFTTGKDKIVLNDDHFTALTSSITTNNLIVGAGATASDANDFLIFDTTTNTLKYDADGSGVGVAVNVAVLTGVSTIAISDFVVV